MKIEPSVSSRFTWPLQAAGQIPAPPGPGNLPGASNQKLTPIPYPAQSGFRSFKRGFTLIELMVAMAITTIIVTILISITSMATDTWNRSRAELRASRQAKAMVDTMAHDLESLVTRRGNSYEWLSAVRSISAGEVPGDKVQSSNYSKLIFFAGATDRYDGNIGNQDATKGKKDDGGDVSGVAYKLFYKDPIDKSVNIYKTFVFNRLLIDPKPAFNDLLGKADLDVAFAPYNTKLEEQSAFVCENVYQFTITFHVMVSRVTSAAGVTPVVTETISVPVTIGKSTTWPSVSSLKIKGTGVVTDPVRPAGVATGTLKVDNVTGAELSAGRVVAVELSITVLADSAIDQIRRSKTALTDLKTSDLLVKYGFNYSKRIQVPSL